MTDSILDAVQHHPFSQGLTPEHCATLASLGSQVNYARTRSSSPRATSGTSSSCCSRVAWRSR